MLLKKISITLKLKGPVLFRSSVPGPVGLDEVAARDWEGRCFIPGTLIRGCLVDSLRELRDFLPKNWSTEEWLGKDSEDWKPHHGRLLISDFPTDSENHEKNSSKVISGIKMDESRGAVKKGALRMVEAPFAAGEEIDFCGEIQFFCHEAEVADETVHVLDRALRWIASMGGDTNVGFGQVLGVQVNAVDTISFSAPEKTPTVPGPRFLDLELKPEDPFCVSSVRVNDNTFRSLEIIQGSVIKGTLAQMLKSVLGLGSRATIDDKIVGGWATLAKNFSNLKFLHAYPTDGTDRPVVPPLSVVKVPEDKSWWDIAEQEYPVLIKSKAPLFAVDWKNRDDVDAAFGWSFPRRRLMVRTAVDTKRRKAADEKLFGLEMILPGKEKWLGRIDLSLVEEGERGMVTESLRVLLSGGLLGVGKTKSRFSTVLDDCHEDQMATAPNDKGEWVLTLQSSAMLCDPRNLEGEKGFNSLENEYSTAFDEMSGGQLQLVRFFSEEVLQGGYLGKRFQSNSSYNPFLLTNSGSVFVLRKNSNTRDDEGESLIARWLSDGLPMRTWAKDMYGETWQTNPFTPADGWGEIAVNNQCHSDKKPLEGDIDVIEEFMEN